MSRRQSPADVCPRLAPGSVLGTRREGAKAPNVAWLGGQHVRNSGTTSECTGASTPGRSSHEARLAARRIGRDVRSRSTTNQDDAVVAAYIGAKTGLAALSDTRPPAGTAEAVVRSRSRHR
jgi:hypothetical protein